MKVFHRTFYSDAILAEGFRDSTGTYLSDSIHSGVWVSDVPLDENEGADGDKVLLLEIPDHTFAEYEWVEEGNPYREALIPAAILNGLAQPVLLNDEQVWEYESQRFLSDQM